MTSEQLFALSSVDAHRELHVELALSGTAWWSWYYNVLSDCTFNMAYWRTVSKTIQGHLVVRWPHMLHLNWDLKSLDLLTSTLYSLAT